MYNLLSNLLTKHNIDIFAPVSLSNCEIKRAYLLEREGISYGTVFVIAVPYLSQEAFFSRRNISLYAVPRDYHLFFSELFAEILPVLREQFPNNKFAAFADHSPINEVDAAAKAGLGVLGDNGTLICKDHASFVFLGEIITDIKLPLMSCGLEKCEGCGMCAASCMVGFERKCELCISHLSQTKGNASDAIFDAIKSSNLVWGCDACILACPHTKAAIESKTAFTSIDFFKSDLIPYLTSDLIRKMSDEDFSARAYSWRKRDVILRNLDIYESLNGKEDNYPC